MVFVFCMLDIELEDDPEQKITEDSQEKDYLPDFQLDEELGDGEDIEQDILLEDEEEGEEEGENGDEEADEEDIEEEEEKPDDEEVKEVEEGVEEIKLEEENGEDTVQVPSNDYDDKEDEVVSHFYFNFFQA